MKKDFTMNKKLIAILLISLAIGFFGFLIVENNKISQKNQSVTLLLKNGESLSHLAFKLKKNKLILSQDLFKIYAVLNDYDKSLRSGEYELNSSMSMHEILEKFKQGKVVYHRITIPEGLTVAEIHNIINVDDKLTGKISLKVKEGYLLPETYSFTRGDSRNSILLQMQSAMEENLDDIWRNRDKSIDKQIRNKADLLKLASIVEKETVIDAEKPIVAKVYLNRLRVRMRLQADPTVIYGAKNYQGDITYKMLKEKNDYNTYTMYGLPKTAIANPGLVSLVAVANPADVDYLYFVANGKGGHVFTKTYANHKQKVKEYLNQQKRK